MMEGSTARRHANGLVVTRTPLRISLAGGGSDLPAFYEADDGAALSSAIDKYIYVSVKRHGSFFDEPIRINYSRSEMVDRIDDIENDIARECLRFLDVEPPIYVSVVGDLPAASGLGGSSSFAVGLLNALHAYRGERVSAGQLAEEASRVEIEILGEPIGKQDQYAAAFGGLNLFEFRAGGRVRVESLLLRRHVIDDLFGHLMLFWTGTPRSASQVLEEQRANTGTHMTNLIAMRDHAHHLRDVLHLEQPDMAEVGHTIHASWLLKRELASGISSSQIDAWYAAAIEAGAYGGKVAGAGGGGFLLFVVPPACQDRVREALGLVEVPFRHEAHGSQLILPSIAW